MAGRGGCEQIPFDRSNERGAELRKLYLQQSFELAPLFFGGASRTFRSLRNTDRRLFLLHRPEVFFRRSQIFEEITDKLGADAILQETGHLYRPQEFLGACGYYLANADRA